MRTPRSLLLLPVLVAVAALAPASASAGTARLATFISGRGSDTFNYVIYTAAPGERNVILATTRGSGDALLGVIHDTAGATAGAGCSRPVPSDPDTVTCPLASAGTDASDGAAPAPQAFDIRAGDGNDRVRMSTTHHLAATIDGGAGNDVLTGGRGGGIVDEETPGLTGNDLTGGPGNDVLTGGPADDLFSETGAGPNGSDTIRGLGGIDTLDYTGRRHAVEADLRGDRHAGEHGENDHLASDLEQVLGGRGPDLLVANARGSGLAGGPGADRLMGGRGPDRLVADEPPSDPLDFEFSVPSKRDHFRNRLTGGGGNDLLVGGAGSDVLDAGAGEDRVSAGAGADVVRARDGRHDEITCGAGRDRATLDGRDFATGCERRATVGTRVVTLIRGLGFAAYDSLTAGRVTDFTYACPADYFRARCAFRVTVRIKGRVASVKKLTLRRGTAKDLETHLNAYGVQQTEARETTHAALTLTTREPGGRVAVLRYAVLLER